MAYVTPVLLDFWKFLTNSVMGLGGEYMVSNLQIQLLLILLAVVTIQTTFLVVKLNNIEEQL